MFRLIIISLLLLLFGEQVFGQDGDMQTLDSLFNEGKIKEEDYKAFTAQLIYRDKVNLNKRVDSMAIWKLDIIYTKEIYHPETNSFELREYYYQSEKPWFDDKDEEYGPKDIRVNGKHPRCYCFVNKKEHMDAIIEHMASRKLVTKVKPVFIYYVITPGCGMSWTYWKGARKRARKAYRNSDRTKYYVIEKIVNKGETKISFQKPVNRRSKIKREGCICR